jgi:probable HAF family extracellular repeat protein
LRSRLAKFAVLAAVGLMSVASGRSANAGAYTLTDLGTVAGTTISFADGLNDTGQVVGTSGLPGGPYYAALWSGGSVINLGGLPGSTFSGAKGINDAGQIVGYSGDVAAEWYGGSIINLGGLPGSTGSEAIAINGAGKAVGSSWFGVGYFANAFATEWSGGNVINLGGLPGSTFSEAIAINNAGQIVGYSQIGGVDIATEWSNGSVINLGGPSYVEAEAINGSGDVVGSGFNLGGGSPVATLWSGGNVIDLKTALDISGAGWLLYDASGINSLGQIVGTGPGPSTGTYAHAFLLTYCASCAAPTPEPSTWALMLLGFAGLGFAGYRRVRRGDSMLTAQSTTMA